MKNNTYACLIHEKRFDLYTSNFQIYKNIYNDIHIIHIDSWDKEEYINYCNLFLKNIHNNHFIDNILNTFKKKVILNTLEDDSEHNTKPISIKKKDNKEKNKTIFINSVDYIKNKNEENETNEKKKKKQQ